MVGRRHYGEAARGGKRPHRLLHGVALVHASPMPVSGARRRAAELTAAAAVALAIPRAAAAEPPSPAPAVSDPDPRPPRIDGAYLGFDVHGNLVHVRAEDVEGVFGGGGGSLRAGEVVLPWLTIGLHVHGSVSLRETAAGLQRHGQGALLVEFGFLPVPRIPLSLRAGFGIGGGAVTGGSLESRAGFGGAVFQGSIRYELFPGARRYRPRRGGGFGLGPELGWIGTMPAAPGRPMTNLVHLSLMGIWYFGR